MIQKVIGPLTPEQNDLFMSNPNFSGLKFPDMGSAITLQRKYYKKVPDLALSLMEVNTY